MSLKKKLNHLALGLIAAGAVLASGCTKAGMMPGPASEAMGIADPGFGVLSATGADGAGPGGFGMRKKMIEKLGLTAEQQAQLKELHKKHRDELRPKDFQAHREELKKLLLAEKVDGAALKAFIEARKKERMDKLPQHIAVMSEMRAVLTEKQRAELVSMIAAPSKRQKQDMEGMRAKMKERINAALNLTAEQKAAMDALEAKMKSLMQEGHEPMKNAIGAFIQSGDEAALQRSITSQMADKLPVDEIVRVAVSLDQSQRQKIAQRFGRFMGGHGGRGRWGKGRKDHDPKGAQQPGA